MRTICDLTQSRLKATKEVFGTCKLRYTQDSVDLQNDPDINAEEIRQAMDAVYYRCGTYHRIRKAVARAAELALQSGSQAT